MTRTAAARAAAAGAAPALAIALALVFASVPAFSNMRAPRVVPRPPSSALRVARDAGRADPADPVDLVARHERLTLDCTIDACRVEAIYQVRSAHGGAFAFAFVLPAETRVHVRAGSSEPEVTLVPAASGEAARDAHTVTVRGTTTIGVPPAEGTLYEALFRATLPAGDAEIRVDYTQRTFAYEAAYGYFTPSRFVHALPYELGPIREWTLAPGFAIDVEARFARDAPRLWTRLFGSPQTMTCLLSAASSNGEGEAALDDMREEQRPDQVLVRGRIRGRVPDRLVCHLGDEDLLPGRATR